MTTETVSLTIDGVPVTVPKGTLLVEAAKTIKQQIPIYCYHTKLGPRGSVPHLYGGDRRDAQAADRVQHRRDRRHGGAGRKASASSRRGPWFSSSSSSTIRWTVRSATRAASASSRTTRWPTRAAPPTSRIRSFPSRRRSISGRRSCSTRSAASCASAACASTTSSPTNASSSSRIAARATSSRPPPAVRTGTTSRATSPNSVPSGR